MMTPRQSKIIATSNGCIDDDCRRIRLRLPIRVVTATRVVVYYLNLKPEASDSGRRWPKNIRRRPESKPPCRPRPPARMSRR